MSKIQVHLNHSTLIQFCQKWKIVRLALFGSVLRNDFRSDSDIDVMLTFAPDAGWGLLDLGQMQFELSEVLGRTADIVEEGTIRNPIRRRCIYENLEVVYESGR